ncbi:MAG TPA: glycosyltransferase family 4 protein, partial [Pyrinomonadaceae bacterium]
MSNNSNWLCCQIGAREHYAIPRALQRVGSLKRLFTDSWIRPNGLPGVTNNGRFHEGLESSVVSASNMGSVRFELIAKARGYTGWQLIQARNGWFQEYVLDQLKNNYYNGNGQPPTVFAYSYAAERIFAFARGRGWKTVLGQIDPGPKEEELVAELSKTRNCVSPWEPAPASYWQRWQRECDFADCIVVNSDWSRDALVTHGIAADKIKVIPLAFEPSAEAKTFIRTYPLVFTPERPLRVLFLGQVCLRKGIGALFQAITQLQNEPIEFWFVGPMQVEIPSALQSDSRVRWMGSVPRLHTSDYYRKADVFIFPTLSDGFGLTQLEAQSWKLPVIASRYCGSVVEDGVNGYVLPEVSAAAIENA